MPSVHVVEARQQQTNRTLKATPMQDTRMLIACLITLCSSALALAALGRLAIPFGLIDHPNERKHHDGGIPLVGGLAIFIGVLAGALFYGNFQNFNWALLGSAGILVMLGSLDDRFDLSVHVRLLVQTSVILGMISPPGCISTRSEIFSATRPTWVGSASLSRWSR